MGNYRIGFNSDTDMSMPCYLQLCAQGRQNVIARLNTVPAVCIVDECGEAA